MDARIRIFLRIIDEHGGALRMTTSEIGGLLGIGKARLFRLFRKEVGKALRQHLLEVRMARAAEFVRDLATPVKTIASLCGYPILSNFYRDFKRVHGVTPIQMRLRYLNAQLQDEVLPYMPLHASILPFRAGPQPLRELQSPPSPRKLSA